MKKEDLQAYHDHLLALRARLRGDVSNLADAALRQSGLGGADATSMPIHMAELGSENFEQELTLSVMETEEGMLAQIDMAIKRIEQGEYGICVQCGGKIPKRRLDAIPYTGVCVKCADQKQPT
ncbi:MAG: TraR/DksA C4-type zinc finger protein [Pirellulales bacterium]|nr:TraR/DksA C4-type zinc finger protein [Pirellulales bacterium]